MREEASIMTDIRIGPNTKGNNGKDGGTFKSTNKNCGHFICRAVSFNEEDITTDQGAAPILRKPSARNNPRKATTLQKRMQQLNLELESVQQSQRQTKPLPILPKCDGNDWAEHQRTETKGDKLRQSNSDYLRMLEMVISHHRKKGIVGSG